MDITLNTSEQVSVSVVGITASGAERAPKDPISWSVSDATLAHFANGSLAATMLLADLVGSGSISVSAEGLTASKTFAVVALVEPLVSLRIDAGKPQSK